MKRPTRPLAALLASLGLSACTVTSSAGAPPSAPPKSPARPTAQGAVMTDAEMISAVKQALTARGQAGAGSYEYSATFVDESLPAWRVCVAMAADPSGMPVAATRHAALVDLAGRRVYYKDPAGFGALLKAAGDASKLGPEALFNAWYAASEGGVPATSYGPMGIPGTPAGLTAEPSLERGKDGGYTVTAFTTLRAGAEVTRYRIAVHAGGAFDVKKAGNADLMGTKN